MLVFTRTPSVFLWGGKAALGFAMKGYTFFRHSSHLLWSSDFDNQQHFVLNSVWLILCHWWAGIFVNKFRHFGKTIVMCRGVTRLDGAKGKKQVWRPHVRTWGLSEANVLFWKKCIWHCCDFLAPRSDLTPGELCPLAPLVTSLVLCNKNRKLFRKETNFRHELRFHEHLQFSNTIGLPHGFCTDCERRLLATFQVSRIVFVSLLILPHVFFRHGPVFFFPTFNKLLF